MNNDNEKNIKNRSRTSSSISSMPNNNNNKTNNVWTILMMLLLVFLGSLNFILVKAMYNAFGASYAFFANQGVNFLYVVYGGVILQQKLHCTNEITKDMRTFPQTTFFKLAILDAFGTFFTAMGAVFTPMEYQPILNQTLIPFTMLASFVFLGRRYYLIALLGACLIFAGATVSVAPALIDGESKATTHYRWYSCVIYMLSNVPMALSAVYKEKAFAGRRSVNVWYLCFWVAFYQFLVSFLFIPFLALPFIGGSSTATPLSELPQQFMDGFQCWLGKEPDCICTSYWIHFPTDNGNGQSATAAATTPTTTGIHCPLGPPLLLIPLYTLVNFLYNGAGLVMTKHGSAVLRYISYAMILPITTIVGAPIFNERVTIYTYFGLVIVIIGFGFYQSYGQKRKKKKRKGYAPMDDLENISTLRNSLLNEKNANNNNNNSNNNGLEEFDGTSQNPMSPPISIQSSFQERVVGMGLAHKSLSPIHAIFANRSNRNNNGILQSKSLENDGYYGREDDDENGEWQNSL